MNKNLNKTIVVLSISILLTLSAIIFIFVRSSRIAQFQKQLRATQLSILRFQQQDEQVKSNEHIFKIFAYEPDLSTRIDYKLTNIPNLHIISTQNKVINGFNKIRKVFMLKSANLHHILHNLNNILAFDKPIKVIHVQLNRINLAWELKLELEFIQLANYK